MAEQAFLAVMIIAGAVFFSYLALVFWLTSSIKRLETRLSIVFIAALPVIYPLASTGYNMMRTSYYKSKSTAICKNELLETPGPFLMPGFYDETGGINSIDIEHLLTIGHMRFIEVNISVKNSFPNPKLWVLPSLANIAHFELGLEGDERCFYPQGINRDTFFTKKSPVKPGTCLLVEYLDQPTARYGVTTHVNKSSGLSEWELRQLSTNQRVAKFSDAFSVIFPELRPRTDFSGRNQCRGNGVTGYATLINQIKSDQVDNSRRSGHVYIKNLLKLTGMPEDYKEFVRLKGESKQITSSIDYQSIDDEAMIHKESGWPESVALSQRHGSWIYSGQLIDSAKNELSAIPGSGGGSLWATTGSQLIFFRYQQGPGIMIIGFDLDGNRKWTAKLSPPGLAENGTTDYSPRNFQLTESALLFHVRYSERLEKKTSVDTTISIPLDQLKLLEHPRQSSANSSLQVKPTKFVTMPTKSPPQTAARLPAGRSTSASSH